MNLNFSFFFTERNYARFSFHQQLDNNELRSNVPLNIEGESCEIKYRRRVNYAQLRVQRIDIFLSHFPSVAQSAKIILARTKLVDCENEARIRDILTLTYTRYSPQI